MLARPCASGGLHVTTRKDERSDGVSRRAFLAGASAAGVALAGAEPALAQTADETAKGAAPSGAQLAHEQGAIEYTAQERERYFVDDPGSDFMVDVIKSARPRIHGDQPGLELPQHPRVAHELRRQQEARAPHVHARGAAVAMAHGYAKAAGKPIGAMIHGTVGLQHGSMAIYNAWVDRVPIMLFAGNGLDGDDAPPALEWNHSVQDARGRWCATS